MATDKLRTSLWASQVLTAGAGDITSSTVDLSDGYGAWLNIKLTNGATGPTLPAEVQIEVSHDATNWFHFGAALAGGTGNNEVKSWGAIEIPIGAKHMRLVAGSNTGQNVTVTADVAELSKV